MVSCWLLMAAAIVSMREFSEEVALARLFRELMRSLGAVAFIVVACGAFCDGQ